MGEYPPDGSVDGFPDFADPPRMRLALGFVFLAACSDPNAQAQADVERMVQHHREETPAPPSRKREVEKKPDAAETPPASAPKPVNCAGTRADRVADAKDAIRTWNAHVEEARPLWKWAVAHKCQLKDTTGTFLVRKTRDSGGIRVEVKKGGPDEVVCDTKPKEGVDATLLREMALLEETTEDDSMFETFPQCDAVESPSLRVTFGDTKGQKAILALP